MTILNMFLTKEEIHTTSISLNHNSISFNSIGQTIQLVATLVPSGSVDTVSWSSSNTSVATVSYKGLVTCVGDGNCTITATTSNGLSTTCSVAVSTALFDFGDWSSSTWTAVSGNQGTVTKTSSYISFYRSGGYAINYLSQYQIDGTKDFLLEMRANIPNTYAGYHFCGLSPDGNDANAFMFGTSWESSQRDKIGMWVNGANVSTGETNPGTVDYFIRRQGTTLTMGWGGVTKYTNNNFTPSSSQYYLYERVYNDTLTIYTAKLTYL